MSRVCFLCVLFVLYLQFSACFSADRQFSKRVLGMQQSEGLDPSRKLCLCVLKSKPTTKDSVVVNDSSSAQTMESVDQSSEEPPFASGFVPLLRAIFPKPATQNDRLETAPVKLPDDGRPASSSTCTLSRYSRGFIPIIRSLFR
uniref:Uncharacterized protein n=1 Tax=Cryptomonas curvata TaxID=233186 RepID=A0A7S0M5I6_9CRYP|mmetsp:Transcript_25788/g.53609  ORF Transcript_25788/g.53609 Transcript_25788/m.53609 type:complete len:144 (+) Transcript_25788:36-467(+)